MLVGYNTNNNNNNNNNKDRISTKLTVSQGELSELHQARCAQTSDDSGLSQAVSAKLEDSNLRAAIRLLMSHDTPATPSAEYSIDQVKQKHPQASLKAADLPSQSQTQYLLADESEVSCRLCWRS